MEKKRKGYTVQEQQTAATNRYRNTEKGAERTKYVNYRSYAKNFILKQAEKGDLMMLKELIDERLKNI